MANQNAEDILELAFMQMCKPIITPVPEKGRHFPSIDEPYPDPYSYQILVGALQYAKFTGPDLSYGVNLAL